MLAFRSFRLRLVTTQLLAAVAAGVLTAALLLWIGDLTTTEIADTGDEATFAVLVEATRHYAEEGRPLAATPLLESATASRSIELAVLTDEARTIVASSDPDWIGRVLESGGLWTVASIGDGEATGGFVAVRHAQHLWRTTAGIPILLAVLLVLSVVSLVLLATSRLLFRRFQRLHVEAKQLAQVSISTGDELSTIGRALDNLKRDKASLELAMEDRDKQIRALTDDLPVGMSYVDQDLRMRFLNRTLEGWLGWKRQAILGLRLSEFMTPEHFKETLRGIEPALQGSKVQRERDFTIDGSPAVIATINIPDRGPGGKVQGVFSLLRDVTRRRIQESEQEHLLAELAAKNAELERFSYTVSHDLKGPLTTIVGSADLIAMAFESGETGQVEEDLDRIRDTADTMRRMLDELLDLARVGLVANQETRVDLGQLATETLRLLAGSIGRHGTRTTVAHDLPAVVGDRQRLQRALQNLIDNAVKFSADVEHPEVEIGCRADGAETVIFVRDNGRGIPPPQQATVFDLFSKLDADSEGTGIGLAIVQRIITGHRGRIWVESAGAGHGTSFCFTLPLAENDGSG